MWCCKSNEAIIEPRSTRISNIPEKSATGSFGTENGTNVDSENAHDGTDNVSYGGFFVDKNVEETSDSAPAGVITISYEDDGITTCFSENSRIPQLKTATKSHDKDTEKNSAITSEDDGIANCLSDQTPDPYYTIPNKQSRNEPSENKTPLDSVPEEPIATLGENHPTRIEDNNDDESLDSVPEEPIATLGENHPTRIEDNNDDESLVSESDRSSQKTETNNNNSAKVSSSVSVQSEDALAGCFDMVKDGMFGCGMLSK